MCAHINEILTKDYFLKTSFHKLGMEYTEDSIGFFLLDGVRIFCFA